MLSSVYGTGQHCSITAFHEQIQATQASGSVLNKTMYGPVTHRVNWAGRVFGGVVLRQPTQPEPAAGSQSLPAPDLQTTGWNWRRVIENCC